MCGIAGFVNPIGQQADRSEIEAMTATLRHRGPDAQGVYVHDNVAIGHRRLSIIDTSVAANQPMFNEDGSVSVVFNGEIYNYRSLVDELQSCGHQFKTQSDTEVIVHAWEQWGVDCVLRFRGMFAFAVYDASQCKLFIARDRLGKKPLYYATRGGRFFFASEIKAIRYVLGKSDDLDCEALRQYVTYGFTVGESTIYRDIRRLEAAHRMLLDLSDNVRPQSRRYWDVNYATDLRATEGDWIDRIDHALSESVRLRLASDVPLGAFLSGGIDSSLVVAYMAKHCANQVKTFTIGFQEASHDESKYAFAVAEQLGVQHHVDIVKPDAIDVLDHLAEAYDEPYGDESAIPTFYLCRNTRQHVTVALSGDGGDETFLGYNRYANSRLMNSVSHLITPLGRTMLHHAANWAGHNNRFRRPLQRQSLIAFDLYHHAMGYSADNLSILSEDVRQQLDQSRKHKMAIDFARCDTARIVDRYGYTDLMNYLPDDILVKVDRASMHHSLEVRCPLLDHELVELAHQIPTRFKLRFMRGKYLLRRLLRRFLPSHLIDRPKMGFGVPLAHWFRHDLKRVLGELISDQQSAIWSWFDRRAVELRFKAHLSGHVNHQATLWRCMFFHAWLLHQSTRKEERPCRQEHNATQSPIV